MEKNVKSNSRNSIFCDFIKWFTQVGKKQKLYLLKNLAEYFK